MTADLATRLVQAASKAIDATFGPEKGIEAWTPCSRAAVGAVLEALADHYATDVDATIMGEGGLRRLAQVVKETHATPDH